MVDDFLGQVNEWYVFRILSFVINNFIVQVVDNDVHYKFLLVSHIGF